MVTKVFLDANVILDFILKREKFERIKNLFQLSETNKIKLFISTSILHIIAYWLTKNLGLATTKTTMLYLLDNVTVVDGNHECAVKALESNFTDIEDAIQYYIALQNKMDYIISFDKGFQKYSSPKLEIMGVEDFLAESSIR